jgi:hypothetical protein
LWFAVLAALHFPLWLLLHLQCQKKEEKTPKQHEKPQNVGKTWGHSMILPGHPLFAVTNAFYLSNII